MIDTHTPRTCPEFRARCSSLSSQDFTEVQDRLIKNGGMSHDEALKSKDEFLKFISLRFISDASLVPSKLADEFWHAFILFTKEYDAFLPDALRCVLAP